MKGCLGVVALLAVLVLVFGALAGPGDSRGGAPSCSAQGAYAAGQIIAERRLRAPGSARWPMVHEDEMTRLADCRWRIVTHVDSENGFGALLRTRVVMEVGRDGEGDWRAYRMDMVEG